jgi:hypothetical protein
MTEEFQAGAPYRFCLNLDLPKPSLVGTRPGTFFAAQFSAGYTTNTSGFDLRQTQVAESTASAERGPVGMEPLSGAHRWP